MTNNIPTMLTIKETAKRSGLAQHYLRSLCINDTIVHVKCGTKYLINFEKLIDFLNGNNTDTFQAPLNIDNEMRVVDE